MMDTSLKSREYHLLNYFIRNASKIQTSFFKKLEGSINTYKQYLNIGDNFEQLIDDHVQYFLNLCKRQSLLYQNFYCSILPNIPNLQFQQSKILSNHPLSHIYEHIQTMFDQNHEQCMELTDLQICQIQIVLDSHIEEFIHIKEFQIDPLKQMLSLHKRYFKEHLDLHFNQLKSLVNKQIRCLHDFINLPNSEFNRELVIYEFNFHKFKNYQIYQFDSLFRVQQIIHSVLDVESLELTHIED